jgi:hypothetical protein
MLQGVGKTVGAFDREYSISFIVPGHPVLVVLLWEIYGQNRLYVVLIEQLSEQGFIPSFSI